MSPLAALRHHVTGAIGRGEKNAIVGETLKARLIIGNRAYALITGDTWEMNILLSPGQSATNSLISTANEYRAKAEKLIRDANRMTAAAQILHK
jgi:hypothetical protein